VERSTVSTRFGDIAYVDVGEGPAALFVHGVFLNADLWRKVIAPLQNERRCIAVDLPCHGQTRVKPDQEVTLPAMADMLAALCDALGLDQVDLVGNDSGGAVAQVFAARHAARLRTLVLTNCDTHDNIPPPNFEQPVQLAFEGQLAPVIAEMAANPELARSELGLGAGYEHPENLTEDDIHGYLGPFKDVEAGRQVERFITSLSPEQLLEAEPALKELRVPTLVVWGTADTFFELSWAYWLRDTIPGVTDVVEIEGAKLFFPAERADELVPLLRNHWAAHR
jgi:pimeloyl-ACP methyl ester carboxylesterase